MRYVAFLKEHMYLEETVILPEAEKCLSEADWKALDSAFEQNRDPLSGRYPPNPAYDRLFTRIVMQTGSASGWGKVE
jgi:hemerythrin-like domain-containing protein